MFDIKQLFKLLTKQSFGSYYGARRGPSRHAFKRQLLAAVAALVLDRLRRGRYGR